MAALSGALAASPLGGLDNPAISASLSGYAVDYWPAHATERSPLISGALARNLPVSATPRNLAGSLAGAYSDDYYHRIHVSLARINAGNVSSEQVYTLTLWNAYLTPQAHASTDLPEGVSLDPEASDFAPLDEQTYTVTIDPEGPAIIEGSVTLGFTGLDPIVLPLSGSRVTPWPWLPDWNSGVLMRLEWKTDVLPLADGAEQRIDLRQGARWQYEFAAAAEGTDRRHLEAALWAAGAKVWGVPLWHDTRFTTAAAPAGATGLALDTTFTDFRAGGEALLLGASSRDYEVVAIAEVTDSALLLAGATVNDWPAGTRVIPTRPGRLADQPLRLDRFTGQALAPVRFRFELEDPWDGTPAELPTYRGYPVLDAAPNWASGLTLELARDLAQLDALVGGWATEDRTGVPVPAQVHGWTLTDRAAVAAYLDRLALLRGRMHALWVPTFADDLTLVNTVAASGTTMQVAWCGYAQHLVGEVGRRDIRILLTDGTVAYARISDAVELTSEVEQLTLEAGPGVDVTPATVASISFMALMRQQSDAAELAFWTADVAESRTTWQGFNNDV